MLAVIKTGGKQYLVSPSQKIKIEKINKKEGSEVVFKEVLLVQKGNKIQIGRPFVKGAKVIGKVVGQSKGEKITILKYKPKTRYKKKKGYRHLFTEVEITKIEI
ncbi:50S ribosomal protein L21 [bacterium]|nr:50S ribosomal protein L21 [bacterium]